jgi:prevent-host-death family protein
MSKTRAIKLTEARSTFSALVNDVYRTHDRVIVEKSGIPVAAIVSVTDLERLDQLDRQRAADIELLKRFASHFENVSPEELEAEVAKAIAEVRAEYSTEVAER